MRRETERERERENKPDVRKLLEPLCVLDEIGAVRRVAFVQDGLDLAQLTIDFARRFFVKILLFVFFLYV